MIIRSGLIRNRDDVDFTRFSEHWRHVHGPLALRVEAMRAYRQNHVLARLPSPQAEKLHRVDGISQLWFDDLESMQAAMNSSEQRACVEDIRAFLDEVTILVQQEGDMRRHGDAQPLPVKFIYLLAGPEAALKALGDRLLVDLSARSEGVALRINLVIDRNFSVDPTVRSGRQVIDAVMEVWLPEGANDAAAQGVLAGNPDIGVVGAFQVHELILKDPKR
jgi:uncharacterized protein (TIGR02118 family)